MAPNISVRTKSVCSRLKDLSKQPLTKHEVVLLQLSWTSEVYDEVAERIAKEWYSRARKYSTSFIYGPYTDSFQNPFEAISDSDRAFLLRVSNRYDPGKMFQQMVPGGFKLLPPASFPISNLEAAGD